jgi:hypothetical protein
MIGVLVRDEDGINLVRVLADGLQALDRFTAAEAGIN